MRKLLDGDSDVGAMSNLKQARKSARPTFFFSRPEQMMKVTIRKEHAHLRLTRKQDLLKTLPRFSGPCVLVQKVSAILVRFNRDTLVLLQKATQLCLVFPEIFSKHAGNKKDGRVPCSQRSHSSVLQEKRREQ